MVANARKGSPTGSRARSTRTGTGSRGVLASATAREWSFPRFKKKGRDADRVSFTTGAMRVEPDRRHRAVIGCVRTRMRTPAASSASSPKTGRGCWRSHGAPQRHPAGCECAGSAAPPTATWNCLLVANRCRRGCSSIWPRSPPRTAHAARSWCQTANAGHYPRGGSIYQAVRKTGRRRQTAIWASSGPPDVWDRVADRMLGRPLRRAADSMQRGAAASELDLAAGMDSAQE